MRYFKVIILAFFFLSCKKEDYRDYVPRVEMVSATPNEDGTIDVVARINSEGEGELVFAGFCADSLGNPSIETNQVLVQRLYGNEFYETIYPYGIQGNNRIAINAFAGNSVGLGKGSAVVIEGLDAFYQYPKIRPNCFLNDSSIISGTLGIMDAKFDSISTVTPVESYLMVSAFYSDTLKLELRFSDLHTGYYETVSPTNNYDPDEMNIQITYLGEVQNNLSSFDVTVNQTGENSFEISICPYNYYAEFVCKLDVVE